MEAEVHPIDMLVDLVIQGEMDPWDIDIAGLAQRFLEEVRNMVKLNLRLSGRTLLTSAILLRMKSEHLMPQENGHNGHNGHEDYEEYGWDEAYDFELDLPALPTPLRRRAERRVTLFELVEALQQALNEEIIRKNFPPRRRARPRLVIQVDDESIREKIISFYDRILELAQQREVLRFAELVYEPSPHYVVETLLYLLYLDSQGKLTVWQEELFGEIFITLR
jgi:segregation and condensation protein A